MHALVPSGRVSRLATLLCAAAIVIVLCAGCDPARENDFLVQINQLRASRGVPALSVNDDLTNIARTWTDQMIANGGLSHNPSLAAEAPGGWSKLGENVGVGYDVSSLMQAFINSPAHYANLVDPRYSSVGIGVTVTPDGRVWVTQDFMG